MIAELPLLDLVLPLRRNGDLPPLFCAAPATGIGWSYVPLSRRLGGRQPLYALQTRGLTQPDRLPLSMAELVEDYLAEIREIQPAGPYRLLGWSFGGNVMHAVACRLQREGESVALLALLDSASPEANDLPDTIGEQLLLSELLKTLVTPMPDVSGDPLTRARFVELLQGEGRSVSSFGTEALTALPEIFTRHYHLLREEVTGRFDGDVLFFTAAYGTSIHLPYDESWRPHVTGRVENIDIAAEHLELMRPAPLAAIATVLKARLAGLQISVKIT